jgi:YD repeat-containing protein
MRYVALLFFVFSCTLPLHAQKFVEQAILTQGGLGKLPSDAGFSVQKPANGISYTGTLDFTYNLFPLQLNGQLVTFNINYNSKGIKVDEEASEIGLGWSHNFVGKIVRTVNGYDDFAGGIPNGKTIYFNNDIQFVDTIPYPLYQMNFNLKYVLPAKKVREINMDGEWEVGSTLYIPSIRLRDTTQTVNVVNQFSVNENTINNEFEPDQYYVEVPGFSAEFIVDKRGKVYEKNNSGAKYSYTYKLVNGDYEVTWKIVAPSGVTYYFNKYETRFAPNGRIALSPRSISNWYLTQIVIPNGDKIDYTYSARNYNNVKNFTNRNEIQTQGMPTMSYLPDIDLKTWALDSVITRNFKISLARESRKDVASAERITAIRLHRIQQGTPVIDSVHFYQGYFIGTDGLSNGISPSLQYNTEYLTHRLRLDSLSFNISGAKKEDQVYRYEYNSPSTLPAKNSLSRDLWGYYNASGASSLLPKTYLFFAFPSWAINTIGESDRSAGELEHVQKFALKKIIYPTNGYTEIEYENNEFNIKQSNKFNFTGLTILDEIPDPRTLETGYPMDAFGSKVRTMEFYIPPSDLINTGPRSAVSCTLEAVAPVNYNNFDQSPNYQVTFLKIYDSTGKVAYEADYALRNIVRNSSDPTGKQYIINSTPQLLPGKYRMEFSFDKNWLFIQGYILVRINWPRSNVTMMNSYKMKKGPGLRVRKVIHKTDPSSIASTRLYNYNYEEPGKDMLTGADKMLRASYGVLINRPIHFTQRVVRSCEFPNSPGDLRLFSGMVAPVAGDDLGYSHIEELQIGGNDTIKKAYDYNVVPSSTPDYERMYVSGLKYINYPVNGLLMKESSYLGNTNQLILSKSYKYQYELTNEIWGVKYFRESSGTVPEGSCMQPDDVMMVFAYPVMSSGYVKKLSEEEKYFQNGQELTKTTYFQYKDYNKNFISSTTYKDSQGKSIVDSILYVQDLKGTSPAIDTMINRNLLATTVETTKKINGNQISREKITYDLWNNKTIVAPLKEERAFKGGSMETEATYEAYDQYANPLQFRGRNGIVTSLVWGYNNTYPVAKVYGLPYSTIAPFINAGIINNPSNDYTLRKEIDKLRTRFPATNIISNTYTPLLGITSQTSITGNVNYYEYDGQGRLRAVRDRDSNIVRLTEYKYSANVP